MNDFFAMLYEGFSPIDLFYISINNFSDNMFTSGVYITIGLVMIISALLSELFYYFFLSSYGNFYKTIYWFLWIVFIAVINFFVGYFASMRAMINEGFSYTFFEYFTFSMVNVLWTMFFCFLFSIVFKFKSIKASRTPF